MMMDILRKAALAAALALGMGGVAQAATLSFDTWTDTDAPSSTPIVTITEAGTDTFTVNYSPAPGSTIVGSLIALYFQIGSVNLADIAATNFVLSPGDLFTEQPLLVVPADVPANANLNGTAFDEDDDWTFAILFDKKDKIGAENTVSFKLSVAGLDLDDFTRLGLRIQEVGPVNGRRNGSDKLIGTPSTVPLPAGLPLLGLGLGALVLLRRRKA